MPREIELDDLLNKCPECNSSGQKSVSDRNAFFGLGGKHCDHCSGRGFILTKSGQAMRDFMMWLQRNGEIRI